VGRSVGAEIAIVDDEIVIRGPSVFAGYANDPEANRKLFGKAGFAAAISATSIPTALFT